MRARIRGRTKVEFCGVCVEPTCGSDGVIHALAVGGGEGAGEG